MKILISFLPILPFVLSMQLFPHGKSAGDIALVVSNDNTNTLTTGDTDDGIKVITTPNIPFFQRRQNHKVQISTNGYIVFGDECIYNAHVPLDFPLNYEGHTLPIIAPFWTDFHYGVNSSLSYRIHTSHDVVNRSKAFVLKRFTESKFQPTCVLVITWYNVYDKIDNQSNGYTFQLVLTTDGRSTFVIFMYSSLPLDVAAGVGFQDRLDLFRYKFSLESQVGYRLIRTSNVEINGVLLYRVAEEALGCKGKADGRHPHPTECDKYVICSNECVINLLRCNCSQHYHPEYKTCVPAEQYPCHRDIIQDCAGKNAELLEHRFDCSKYVLCLNGKVHKISLCPTGMHFHPSLKVCVWKSFFRCKRGSRKGYVPPKFCEGKQDGDYADPKNCNQYYQCKAGMSHLMSCGSYMLFHPTKRECDMEFNVNCLVGVSKGNPST